MSVNNVTDAGFKQEVLQSEKTVLVDFWAPWCGPCRAMSPVVDEVAEEIGADAKVVKVNVDESPQAAVQFGVTSIPSFVVIKDGNVQQQLVGAQSKQTLADAVRQAI